MTTTKQVLAPGDLGSGHAIDLLTNKAIVPSADVWRKQSDNTQAGADSDAIQHTGNVALIQNLAVRVKSRATSAQLDSTNASNIRLTSGGIVGGITGGEDGKQLTLTNVSNANITLTHDSATATANTKIRIAGGLNFILAPDDSIVLYYDPVSLLWRVSQSVMGAIVNNPQLVCALAALLTPVPLLDAFGKMIGRIAEPTEYTFKFVATTIASLALVLSNGGTYTVDWGDGSPIDTVASSTSVYATHTYASAYTGDVVVRVSCGRITALRNTDGTLSGSVADLPSGLTLLSVHGSNTLSGSVADLPSGLTYLYVRGSNTLSGSVADLPSGLTLLSVQGSNTLSAPTVPTFAASMRLIQIHGVAKSAAFVDNVLAGAANTAAWASEKLVNLRGTNAAPTAAGLASKAAIESKGATVQVN